MATEAFFTALGVGIALALSVGVGATILGVILRLLDYADDMLRAVRRYAHRDMVVREYYDHVNMRTIREYSFPTPEKVELAKKGTVN